MNCMEKNKEKTFLLEQKKDQTEEINQLKEQLDREKKEQLNEIEKLKNELEKKIKVSLHVYLGNKNIALANQSNIIDPLCLYEQSKKRHGII